MMQKLIPGMSPGTPPNVFAGRLHEFLTCRAISRTLDGKVISNSAASFFEELSLQCMLRSMASGMLEVWQLQLLFQELPKLLQLKYPTVAEIKKVCVQLLPQLTMQYRQQENWLRYKECERLLQMLQLIK